MRRIALFAACVCSVLPGAAGAGDPAPSASPPADEPLVIEIQEVETVRRGKDRKDPRFTARKVHYTVEAEAVPGSPISIKAAADRRTITAEGKAGKREGDTLEIRLKGEALEELTGSAVPPGLKGPVFSSRPFAFDGKAEIGKPVVIGVVEDGNKVVEIATILTLKRRQASDAPR